MATSTLTNAPNNPSGSQLVGKALLGLVVGIVIALLIFVVLILMAGMLDQALRNKITGIYAINPLLPLVLIVIAFIGTFVGNIIQT